MPKIIKKFLPAFVICLSRAKHRASRGAKSRDHLASTLPLFCFLFSMFFCSMAVAVPQYINFQSVLRDTSGNLVTGTHSISFKLYDAATGGTAVWTQVAATERSGKTLA